MCNSQESPLSVALARLRAVLVGRWVASVGSAFFGAAIMWHVHALIGTQHAAWFLGIFQFVPAIIILPITVAIIDSWSKAKILLRSGEIITATHLLAAGAAFSLGHQPTMLLTVIAVAIVAERTVAGISIPASRAAIGSSIRQGTRYSSQFYMTLTTLSVGLVTPLLIPIATNTTVSVAFLINGLTSLVSLLCFRFAGMKLLEGGKDEQLGDVTGSSAVGRWRTQLREGFTELMKIPTLRRFIPTLPLIDLAAAAVVVLGPAIAQRQHVVSASTYYALMIGSMALSRVCGPFLFRHFFQYKHDGLCIAVNCVLQGVGYVAAAQLVGTAFYVLPLVIVGVLQGMNTLAVNELIQHECPPQYLGRVFTLLPFLVLIAMPVGPFVSGLLSGVSLTTAISAVGTLLIVAGLPVFTSRNVRGFVLEQGH